MSGAPGKTPPRHVSYRGFARRTSQREPPPESNSNDFVPETTSNEVVEGTPASVRGSSSHSSDVVITGEVPPSVDAATNVAASAETPTCTPTRGTRGGAFRSRPERTAEASGSPAKRLLFGATPADKRRRSSPPSRPRSVRPRLSHGGMSLGGDASRATGTGGAGGGAGAAGTGGTGIIEEWEYLTWKTVRGYLDEARRVSLDYQVTNRSAGFPGLRLALTGRLLTESGKKGWWPPWLLCDEHGLRTHGVRNKTPGVFAKYASRDPGSKRARDFIDGVARIVTRFLRECQIPTAAGREMDEIIGECMSAILHWWNEQRRGASAATEMPPNPPQ